MNDNIIETIEYKTDEKHREVGAVRRDSSGKIIEEREYILDAKGRAIKEIYKNDVGFEREYIYDEYGEQIGKIRRFNGALLDGYGKAYEEALEREHRMSESPENQSMRSEIAHPKERILKSHQKNMANQKTRSPRVRGGAEPSP